MAVFSIKDIEAVSGIRCHTLRIWEMRYGIIKPKRTDSNIRYYDDDDLKCILNISILNRHGYKISEIAKMKREDLCEVVLRLRRHDAVVDNHIKNLISAMVILDEFSFHQTLTSCIVQLGLEKTMISVVFPFLNEVGIMWQVGTINPVHEHFATQIIKQKLYVAIDGNIGRPTTGVRKKFLLFLPESEQHTLGLLFANYILRSRGHDVIYLGQEVPLPLLLERSPWDNPDFIFTTLTSAHVQVRKDELVAELAGTWPDATILLSGIQFLNADMELPPNARLIRNVQEFVDFADNLSLTGPKTD